MAGNEQQKNPLRRAEPADVAGIEAVVRAAYGKYVARIGKPPGPMLEDYAALVRAGDTWILDEGDGIAGLLVLQSEPDHLLVDNVAVDPARQGRGHGRRLLDFAEAEARRRGHPELRLYTNALMHENLALYARLGWIEYARGEQKGYSRVFFRKPLPRVD